MSTIYERMGVSSSLKWYSDLTKMLEGAKITIPESYNDRVTSIKEILTDDVSGLVNTVLDFAVNCSTVDYYVESDNSSLSDLLNNWLYSLNNSLKGKIPVGIKALAKEYFRERWKSGSFIVMRTIWEKVGDYLLPTKIWFVDGEYLGVKESDGVKILGDEQYFIYKKKNDTKDIISLPSKVNEKIFVQKPFTPWNSPYPVPFIIQRGIYRNILIEKLLVDKGSNLLSQAIEYMMLMKKGTEKMAMSDNPDFIYSTEDLEGLKKDLSDFLAKKQSSNGTPVYATGFDTEIEQLIPEYERILKNELQNPIDKRILAGLGLIDIIDTASTSRKESVLNPKPFIQEVKNGVEDFKTLLRDLMTTIVDVNKASHKKTFSEKVYLEVHNSPLTSFFDKEVRLLLRSMYDRGVISKRTFAEVVGEVDFDIEVERRKQEDKEGLEDIMEPPVIQNNGESEKETTHQDTQNNEDESKEGPEAKNYQSASEEYEMAYVEKDKDGWNVYSKDGKHLGGPYKTKKEAIKRLREIEYFKNKGSEETI